MKARFIKDETTGAVTIMSAQVTISDTDRRLVLGKSISCKLSVSATDYGVNIDIPRTPEPSDVTKLYDGRLSGFRATRNNKNQKLSFVFNVTPDKLKTIGEKAVLKEIQEGIRMMFETLE